MVGSGYEISTLTRHFLPIRLYDIPRLGTGHCLSLKGGGGEELEDFSSVTSKLT